MYSFTPQFIDYCRNNFDLTQAEGYEYKSLSVCILDCIYSLNARYKSATNVVDRYAAAYMGGDKNCSGDTVTNLLNNIQAIGGLKEFVNKVLQNHQKIGKNLRPKEEVCYELAQYLKDHSINTMEDLIKYKDCKVLEAGMYSINGIGDAAVNYLFMLAGDANRCKLDKWIRQCVMDACDQDVSNEECQILFREAVAVLKEEYPNLTMCGLDKIIWYKYSKEKVPNLCKAGNR